MPRGCLRFVIVVFPDHTHLLFFYKETLKLFFIFLMYIIITHVQKRSQDGLRKRYKIFELVFFKFKYGLQLAWVLFC